MLVPVDKRAYLSFQSNVTKVRKDIEFWRVMETKTEEEIAEYWDKHVVQPWMSTNPELRRQSFNIAEKVTDYTGSAKVMKISAVDNILTLNIDE